MADLGPLQRGVQDPPRGIAMSGGYSQVPALARPTRTGSPPASGNFFSRVKLAVTDPLQSREQQAARLAAQFDAMLAMQPPVDTKTRVAMADEAIKAHAKLADQYRKAGRVEEQLVALLACMDMHHEVHGTPTQRDTLMAKVSGEIVRLHASRSVIGTPDTRYRGDVIDPLVYLRWSDAQVRHGIFERGERMPSMVSGHFHSATHNRQNVPDACRPDALTPRERKALLRGESPWLADIDKLEPVVQRTQEALMAAQTAAAARATLGSLTTPVGMMDREKYPDTPPPQQVPTLGGGALDLIEGFLGPDADKPAGPN